MTATLYALNPRHPQPRKISQITEALDDGAILAYPTDTVYGFGCDLHNRKAIDRLYRLKNLDPKHLLSFVCDDLSQAARYAHISDAAYRILRRILPGPYTVILQASREVPKSLLQKRKTVGVRVPDSPIATALVTALGRPIISSSAEDRDGQPMSDPIEIRELYGKQLDVVVDGGPVYPEPSTVIDLSGDEMTVVREGKGSLEGIL